MQYRELGKTGLNVSEIAMGCEGFMGKSLEETVADVTKYLNLAIAQGEVPETVREHYAVLAHHASECIAGGACEKRCPFHVGVIENMKKAVQIFGK